MLVCYHCKNTTVFVQYKLPNSVVCKMQEVSNHILYSPRTDDCIPFTTYEHLMTYFAMVKVKMSYIIF